MEQLTLSHVQWNRAALIAFRFFFVYFILYIFPFPISYIPFVSGLLQTLTDLSATICTTFARSLLNLDIHPQSNGSGDPTFHYVQVLLFATCSFVATVVWSLADGARRDYEKLWYYLMILLRYYTACQMIDYGFIKIFKAQFPFPSIERLSQPYGESSPMGLLWTFMGYSTPYNLFTGLLETLGGLLLLFKRTRLLGAMIVIVVMSNIVMLNFSYDVPVKLFSLHLLVMTVFIIAPDVKRLLNFLVYNKGVQSEEMRPVYSATKWKLLYVAGKDLFIAYVLITTANGSWSYYQGIKEYEKNSAQADVLLGEFEVASFALNGKIIRPGEMDTRCWKKVTMGQGKLTVQHMDDGAIPWLFHKNNAAQKIILLSPDLFTQGNFSFNRDGAKFTLQGTLNEDLLKIELRKVSDAPTFLLVSRGFHWINEHPFNR